ncbi:MAG TPA: hypothetical protein VNI84_14250 [Pyrinomonadaceae bacterium]|nr:hypothetical protein [Pyrinomonadaceae bacterium]
MDLDSKLSSLTETLEERLSRDKSICLWLSGGSDSTLLLHAMAKPNRHFGILRFSDGWTRKQKNIVDALIIKHDLTVFSYPPISYFLFGKGEDLTFAAFYAIDALGGRIPILRDFVDGEKCAFDVSIEPPKTLSAPVEFDTHIVGTRSRDAHYSFEDEQLFSGEEWTTGAKEFVAPLWDWTRAEVHRALKTFGVEYVEPSDEENTGNVVCCHNCLKSSGKVFCPKSNQEIEGVEWNGEENLRIFQQDFER